MRKRLTAAGLVLASALTACSPAPPVAVQAPVQKIVIRIDQTGNIFWNGEPVDQASLELRMRQVAGQPHQPYIHLEPDQHASYDDVAKVLATAQRTGTTHIGFTGIEGPN